jgi:hypothetical protein
LESFKYIQYHYHLPSGKIHSFKSEYIVKIIDYGRSFFNDADSKINTKKIRNDELCKIPSCEPNCGESYGFVWFTNKLSKGNYYIDSTQHNKSHDLRLLNDMKDIYTPNLIANNNFRRFFDKLIYDKIKYGTKPLPDDYLKGQNIRTVSDALLGLSDIISINSFSSRAK